MKGSDKEAVDLLANNVLKPHLLSPMSGKGDTIITKNKPGEKNIQLQCDKCDDIVTTKEEMVKHKGHHHVGIKRKEVVQPAEDLNKNKDNKDDTKSDTEDDEEDYNFDCDICGKQLFSNSKGFALKAMITHKRNEHNMEIEVIDIRFCDVCGLKSKSEAHLKHQRRDDHLIKSESMSPPYKKKKDDGHKKVSELINVLLEKVTSTKGMQVETKPVELKVKSQPKESYEEQRLNARFSEVETIENNINQMKEEEDELIKVVRQSEEKAVRRLEKTEREAEEHAQITKKKTELESMLKEEQKRERKQNKNKTRKQHKALQQKEKKTMELNP